MSDSDYSKYKKDLISIFWKYQRETFPDCEKYFECPFEDCNRPPVFKRDIADYNVLIKPDIADTERKELLDLIPIYKRHKWFRSMSNSQALTQSVFGNLKLENKLYYLREITDDEGEPIFGKNEFANETCSLEYTVQYLREPQPTSIDVFMDGSQRISIECKLSEPKFYPCSQPLLTQGKTNYDRDYCDGSYTFQRGRKDRCSLTSKGVLYWKYIPHIFKWSRDTCHVPCPLNRTYQLVRNILTACVEPCSTIRVGNSNSVLIYDERNPAFRQRGNVIRVFMEVKEALYNPSMIKKCSWQKLMNHLRSKPDLLWLTDQLHKKYGI